MIRAIVVEDERSIMNLHTLMLQEHGSFEVVGQFASGAEALDGIARVAADVLLIDVEMPGMSGMELAYALLEQGNRVPIVFVTAYKDYAAEAFQVEALWYLLKPVTPLMIEKLYTKVKRHYAVLSGKSEDGAGRQLRVQLFGSTHVRSSAGELVKWPTRVAEEVFYYLFLHVNQVVNKWTLLDEVWPDMEMERATANLHNSITRLRHLFAEYKLKIRIEWVNQGYRMLIDESLVCDALQLEQLASGKYIGDADTSWIARLGDERILESKGYLWALPIQEKYHQMWLKVNR